VGSALGLRKPMSVALRPVTRFQALAIAGDRHILQAPVDADRLTEAQGECARAFGLAVQPLKFEIDWGERECGV